MLSIVKMDFDSDIEILDDGIKSEVIDIDENSNEDKKEPNIINNAHNLELLPVVYTTKLDDMFVGTTLYPIDMTPTEVTARIIKESKPILRTDPGPPKKGRKNKKRFRELEESLRRVYHSDKKVLIKKEIDIEPDGGIKIELNPVKIEVIDEPIANVKTTVLREQVANVKLDDSCKYSELLKQCKPCRVLLPLLIGNGQVLHGGQLLKANKVPKANIVSSSRSLSSDEGVPLITFEPDLLVERNYTRVKGNGVKQRKKTIKPENALQPKIIEINSLERNKNKVISSTEIAQRLLRNGLLEINDKFSNEHYCYFTDSDSNLLDYFKNAGVKFLYETTHLHDCKYKVNNCCWVKKDEFIQSLYPKVLTYPTSRFIRNPHPCKVDACTCCCRKKKITRKPNLDFIGEQHVASSPEKTLEAGVIRDLEDEIDISIININKTPKLNSTEWLRNLLPTKGTDIEHASLIEKALTYEYTKPPPAKLVDNRRLVTLKKGYPKHSVVVFRLFAEDLIEIYEINEGDIESYLKTACFSNTVPPDIKKLLRKWNVTTYPVCCWYKREETISQLLTSSELSPSAIKFIRTTHSCQTKECKCCCKPEVKLGIKLATITLPTRSLVHVSTLNIWGPTAHQRLPGKDDEDCQITSVMSSPSVMQPLTSNTAMPVTAVPPSLFVTDTVDNDELSREVNTLITSILDRFKDVRLTINSDGKVAAALNTPVNTLSTVELKVLANILSFAQSQVNLLGSKVSSGATLSLSNIINLKVDDVQSNTTIDPNTVYKEFGTNVNLNRTQTLPVQPTNINLNTPLLIPQASTAPQAFTSFTDSMSAKKQQFNDAFSSFVNSKIDGKAETCTPVIEHVFSLKETENTNEDSSSTTVWYRKPATQSEPSSSKTYTRNKRKVDSNLNSQQPRKIKIRSATQLSAVTVDSTSIASNIPQQTPGGLPALYVLPNNGLTAPSLGQPQKVKSMPPPVQRPMLIINPLHNTGGTLMPVSTPNENFQSNIPIILNSASMSHQDSFNMSQLINTDSGDYITVEKNIPSQETTTGSTGDIEQPGPLNDPEMDSIPETVCVFEDEGQKSDKDDDMDSEEDIELKYSPETNEVEEEEDCILGF